MAAPPTLELYSQEITGLKGEIALLRQALEDSKKRSLEARAQHEVV